MPQIPLNFCLTYNPHSVKTRLVPPSFGAVPLAPDEVLILKRINKNQSAHYDSGFIYPLAGRITCTNFKRNRRCGHGIHGWLFGYGDWGCVSPSAHIERENFLWLTILAKRRDMTPIRRYTGCDRYGKVKIRTGLIVYHGDHPTASGLCRATLSTLLGPYETNVPGRFKMTAFKRFPGCFIVDSYRSDLCNLSAPV